MKKTLLTLALLSAPAAIAMEKEESKEKSSHTQPSESGSSKTTAQLNKIIALMVTNSEALIFDGNTGNFISALKLHLKNEAEGTTSTPEKPAAGGAAKADSTKSEIAEPALLIEAVRAGHIAQVNELLHKGFSPNVADDKGLTPLMIAILTKNYGMLGLILKDKRTNVNQKNFAGSTALSLAAEIGDIVSVRALIGKHAHVDELNDKQQSPLMLATAGLHVAVVKELVEALAYPRGAMESLPAVKDARAAEIDRLLSHAWTFDQLRIV